MIIALGQSKQKMDSGVVSEDDLLAQWGSRMWTFPEVLLSPGHQISIYVRGRDKSPPRVVSKNQ